MVGLAAFDAPHALTISATTLSRTRRSIISVLRINPHVVDAC
jgi:hypothetical protein